MFQNYTNVISEISSEMRVPSEKLTDRVSSLISDRKILEKQIIDLNKKVNSTKLSGVLIY